MRVSQSAKFRLDTRAEVLRDLDAKWEVADDVIVTEAQLRSLLHHPRPTTRQLYLVVLSEVSNRLRYGARLGERFVTSGHGRLELGRGNR